MSTKKSQRIGIWIITGALVVGTLGSFLVMILAPKNEAADQAAMQKQIDEYTKQAEAQAIARAASSKPIDGYEAVVFDKTGVTELKVETLVEGSGEALAADSTISANYFGWTSDGKIFDSTNQNGTVNPIEFSLSRVIPGWTKGLTGVKVGSTVRLTIPSDLAYGATGSLPNIGPNEPLQFIVEIKEKK